MSYLANYLCPSGNLRLQYVTYSIFYIANAHLSYGFDTITYINNPKHLAGCIQCTVRLNKCNILYFLCPHSKPKVVYI